MQAQHITVIFTIIYGKIKRTVIVFTIINKKPAKTPLGVMLVSNFIILTQVQERYKTHFHHSYPSHNQLLVLLRQERCPWRFLCQHV